MARRYLLIGCGPAAISAAETIRSRDAEGEISMVCAEPHGYYSRPGLAYYLADEVPEDRLFPFSTADFARLGVHLLFERATGIDPGAHRVTLEGGRQLVYDRLLIATGSRAIPAAVPGAELDGVVKLDDLDDARDLIRRSRQAKAAVVVGGGITALEIAEGLTARGVPVHYFMRKSRYWSNILSESESRVVEDGLRAAGVQIHQRTELARVVGREGRVAAVETGDGAQIACDMVAVALGVRPQHGLAKAAGLDCARGVLVDRHLCSSDPDIFAAGDVAEVRDSVTGRRTLEVLWNSAVAKGCIAGLNMATGATHIYDTGLPLNVTRLVGFKVTIIGSVGSGKDADLEGLARGDSETWAELGEAVMVESDADDVHIRLALGENSIAGAVVMGDQASSFTLQEIIEARADVSAIKASLQAPAAPLAATVEGSWSASGAAGHGQAQGPS
jgi:NAD(P)H-nitrite reductase large subunit